MSVHRPKAVVFDMGKVLLDFDYGIAAERFARQCTVPANGVRALLDQSVLLFEFESGVLETEGFFEKVQKQSGFCGDVAEFVAIFSDIFSPVQPMISLQEELRAERVPTYLFSNTNPIAVGHIQQRYPFYGGFDGYILSCEHGCMKPDPRLYEVVERMSGLAGRDLLYIDDRAENVVTARERNWQAIHYQGSESAIRAVRASGVFGVEP